MNPIEDWLTRQEGLSVILRQLRIDAGLNQRRLAQLAGLKQSKISKVENGRQPPSRTDIQSWLEACGRQDLVETLVGKWSEVQLAIHQDWQRRMSQGQEHVQGTYEQMVRAARRVRYFETVYVPGPLQIFPYAHRVLTEMVWLHDLQVDDVEAAVISRMKQNDMLYNDPKKHFEFLMVESVLRLVLPDRDVMVSQLDRLQTVIGMSNVKLGIIPMGIPLQVTPQNSFQIYGETAVVETFIGETTHDGTDAAQKYSMVFDRLWDDAVTGEKARQLITNAVQDLRESM